MLTASAPFLLFSLVTALFYHVSRAAAWRQTCFLAANLLFLATFLKSVTDFVPSVVLLTIGYVAVLLMTGGAKRLYVPLIAIIIIGFFWLKKYPFFPTGSYLAMSHTTIGLSYIFFRLLHVVIDAHDGNLNRMSLISYLNYTLNFTTLVSGPIQRFQDFIENRPALNIVAVGRATERIVVGLFKVLVVAGILSTFQKSAIADFGEAHTLLERAAVAAWAIGSYTVYLYLNFSGYTDIVVGVARFFEIELPENFDQPFAAKNFLDLWRRWHITLSDWFRTYVYNPLVHALMFRFPSQRVEPMIAVMAFFVTFFLLGFWHGQTWLFAGLGFLLGVGASGNKLYQLYATKRLGHKRYKALAANPLYQMAARGLTFAWLSLGLMVFWLDWPALLGVLGDLGIVGSILVLVILVLAWCIGLLLHDIAVRLVLFLTWNGEPVALSRYLRTALATSMVMVTALVALLMATPAPDVVYKSF